MTCEKTERLIYLHREGELGAREHRRLERHIASCAKCATLASEVREAFDSLRAVPSEETLTGADEGLTDRIMAGVRALNGTKGRRSPGWTRRIPHPSVLRPATALIGIAVLLILLGQEAVMMNRLTRLETRITSALESGPRPLTTTVGTISAADLRAALDAGSLRVGLGGQRMGEGYLVVRPTDLMRMLRLQRADAQTIETRISALSIRIPALVEVAVGDGLDRREVAILLHNREEILKILGSL